jgi:hypothetical protein
MCSLQTGLPFLKWIHKIMKRCEFIREKHVDLNKT